MRSPGNGEPAGTVFGELLRQRRQTPQAFSAEAERFARERDIDATLSPRHVQRLAMGKRADGRPLGPVRAVTRRLLEEMLNMPVEQLLAPPQVLQTAAQPTAGDLALRARIAKAGKLDLHTVALFQQKLDITRVIDRRLGASALLGELRAQIRHMERSFRDVLSQSVRSSLAEVLVDASALAGWQSLDQGEVGDAWDHYNTARTSAREAHSYALEAYACAGQAVVLLDVGETSAAAELTDYARNIAKGRIPRLLYSWINAGHGEALAADGRQAASMRAFDEAERWMPTTTDNSETPYLVYNSTHLARWRGSTLARLGSPEAIDVLSDVLIQLDPTFARAETALRVDLVHVFTSIGEKEQAAAHLDRARLLAAQIGSARQYRRLQRLNGQG